MARRILLAVLMVGGALGVSSCTVPLNGWDGDRNYVNYNESENASGEELLKARIDLKVGEMEVEPADSTLLYSVNLKYDELAFKPDINFSREDGVAQLAVGLEGESGASFRRLGENLMNLRLNTEIPIELSANTGVGEANIDLTGMNVRSLKIQSGVGETEISMLEPNKGSCEAIEINSGVGSLEMAGLGNFGFKDFSFRGGVGASVLDFSGGWEQIGEVVVEVGVGGVEIRLPRDLGAEIRISKGFFSDYTLPEFQKKGDTYFSENIDRVDKVLKLKITAGIGGVEVDWI